MMQSDGQLSISIQGQGLKVTQSIEERIAENTKKVTKIIGDQIEIQVRLNVQKKRHVVDLVLRFSHFTVKVGATTETMYLSIDKAFDKLIAKLRKWKGRIQDHRAKGTPVKEMEVNVLEVDTGESQTTSEEKIYNREIAEENLRRLEKIYAIPKVSKRKRRPLKILTLVEAMMKMELSEDHFLIFRSEEEGMLKVIYRRRDGSYGIISPE